MLPGLPYSTVNFLIGFFNLLTDDDSNHQSSLNNYNNGPCFLDKQNFVCIE